MSALKTPRAFVDDGYTLDFHIAEIPGVSQSLSGTYRPMIPKEVDRLIRGMNEQQYTTAVVARGKTQDISDKLDAHQCGAVAAHLVTWDLLDSRDQSVPISAENVSRLYPPSLQAALINIVSGLGRQTKELRLATVARDPKLTTEQKLEQIAKIIDGPEVIDNQAAVDAKN